MNDQANGSVAIVFAFFGFVSLISFIICWIFYIQFKGFRHEKAFYDDGEACPVCRSNYVEIGINNYPPFYDAFKKGKYMNRCKEKDCRHEWNASEKVRELGLEKLTR